LRRSCGRLELVTRDPPEGQGMHTDDDAAALPAELVLREVEELDRGWFEAELRELLDLA
jgi:hypothetical protein